MMPVSRIEALTARLICPRKRPQVLRDCAKMLRSSAKVKTGGTSRLAETPLRLKLFQAEEGFLGVEVGIEQPAEGPEVARAVGEVPPPDRLERGLAVAEGVHRLRPIRLRSR